ncbi:MAG: IclR family transcriptional regulator [Beutenbergiaceae bacterium]
MTATLQTLDRGIQALEIVARVEQISVADLASELQVARAICYRIVGTLEAHGLLTRGPDRLIRLGGGIATLGARYWPSLLRRSELVLQELADHAGVTGHLSVIAGDELLVVVSVRPRHSDLRLALQVGHRYPLDGAPGWAALALRAPRHDDSEPVVRARRDGYAISSAVMVEGVQGIAAGVASTGQEALPEACVGLVAVTGIDLKPMIPMVMAAAHALGPGGAHRASVGARP